MPCSSGVETAQSAVGQGAGTNALSAGVAGGAVAWTVLTGASWRAVGSAGVAGGAAQPATIKTSNRLRTTARFDNLVILFLSVSSFSSGQAGEGTRNAGLGVALDW